MMKLSTSVPEKGWTIHRATTINLRAKTNNYPTGAKFSTRCFFPFFLLTFIQASWGVWAKTTWRLEFSIFGDSFSESEDEVSWGRFWELAVTWVCPILSLGVSIGWGAWSGSESLSPSFDPGELELPVGGGGQGAQCLGLVFAKNPFFDLAVSDGQEFCRCPVRWQWRHQKAVFS